MTFTSEKEMKEVARESLPECFDIPREHLVSEFDYGKGRTDLVLVNISDEYWSRRANRLELPVPISNKQHLISFLQLHRRGPLTREYFLECGAQPEDKKQESLRWLVDHDFVEELDSGKIRTIRNLRRHVTTTFAVELKLDKWKRALKQASMGRSFAEYRFVAIDESNLGPAYENIEMFKSNNVGLLSINRNGDTQIHWSPDRGEPYSNLYQWKVNESTVGKMLS